MYCHAIQRAVCRCHKGGICKGGLSHIHRHLLHRVILAGDKMQSYYSGLRLQGKVFLGSQMFVIDIFAYTARCVSTHPRLRTVRIEDTHGEIRHLALAYQHKSVTSDAGMVSAPLHRTGGRFSYCVTLCIYIDVIVAQSVHLSEPNFCHSVFVLVMLFS